jgi:hypothetical protein
MYPAWGCGAWLLPQMVHRARDYYKRSIGHSAALRPSPAGTLSQDGRLGRLSGHRLMHGRAQDRSLRLSLRLIRRSSAPFITGQAEARPARAHPDDLGARRLSDLESARREEFPRPPQWAPPPLRGQSPGHLAAVNGASGRFAVGTWLRRRRSFTDLAWAGTRSYRGHDGPIAGRPGAARRAGKATAPVAPGPSQDTRQSFAASCRRCPRRPAAAGLAA